MGVDLNWCCCCDETLHSDDTKHLYIKQVDDEEICICYDCLEAMLQDGKIECVDEGDINEDIYPTYEVRKTINLIEKWNQPYHPI